MASPQRRVLRLIVPHPDGACVAVGPTVDGRAAAALPAVGVELHEGDTTTVAAVRWAVAHGLSPWLVDCVVDQTPDDELGDDAREAMVELPAAPTAWPLPAGWSWARWRDVTARSAAGIATVCATRLAERAGAAAPPPARADWARPGWYETARAWIADALVAAGGPRPDRVVQVRHWGISAVMRVEAGEASWWFKAAGPCFRHEASITAALDRLAGDRTARVVAADVDRSWLLLDDLGPTEVGSADDTRGAIDQLVGLQRRLLDRRDELERAGCPHRPLHELEDRLATSLDAPVARELIALPSERRARLLGGVAAAIDRVAGWDVPETLVHGDFHPGNVAVPRPSETGARPVIFDWSDACVSVPLVDAATWLWWYTDDRERDARVWRWFCEAWARDLGVDPARLDRGTVEVVASAFHVVSYVSILESLEPHCRPEHAEGFTHFFGALERSLPGS